MRTQFKQLAGKPVLLAAVALGVAACAPDRSDDGAREAQASTSAGDRTGANADTRAANANAGDGVPLENLGPIGTQSGRILGPDGRPVGPDGDPLPDADDLADAREQVAEAVAVVNQMKQDSELARLLEQAHGVFIVPDYAKAAFVIGGEGGEGVALLRQSAEAGGGWSTPAFYNVGGISVGAEAGAEAGSIAMLLMTEEAAKKFATEENNFALDANAGLTVVNWSAKAQESAGKGGDVVIWADTEGLLAGIAIGVSDINHDEDETAAYYGREIDRQQILSGTVTDARSQMLRDALTG